MKDFQALDSPSPPGNICSYSKQKQNKEFSFSCFWFIVAFLDRDPLTLFNPDSQHY